MLTGVVAADDRKDDDKSSKSSRSLSSLSKLEKWQTNSSAAAIGYSADDIVIDATRSVSSTGINVTRKGSRTAIFAMRSKSNTDVSGSETEGLSKGYFISTPGVSGHGDGLISVPHNYASQGSSAGLRGGVVGGGSIRPHTPGNIAATGAVRRVRIVGI